MNHTPDMLPAQTGSDWLINPNVSFEYAGLLSSKGEWTHPDRTEKTFEILYITSGTVRICEEETTYTAPKGSLLVLEAGKRHYGIGKAVSYTHLKEPKSRPRAAALWTPGDGSKLCTGMFLIEFVAFRV